MAIRNILDEVHRALHVLVALRGRSTETERQVGLGSLLTSVGRRAGLTEEESAAFVQRDTTPARPIDLE